jgi:adenylosuccinate synthase
VKNIHSVVIGAQWGDEGKGKIVDTLAAEADVIVRYQGGNNAGHTIVHDHVVHKLHLLPAGVVSGKMSVIGNGVVVNPDGLVKEITEFKGKFPHDLLFISDRAHVVLFYHQALDYVKEIAKGKGKIGTTMKGIGPTYTSKASRLGLRMHEFVDSDTLEKRLREQIPKNIQLLHTQASANQIRQYLRKHHPNFLTESGLVDMNKVVAHYHTLREKLTQYVTDTGVLLQQCIDDGKKIFFEGAQATMLDLDHGTYPYVTSSSPSIGGVYTGTGVVPKISRILGVVKAYTTRVGGGPFVTELHDETGEKLREIGGEYGTTTGRPRRCGWLDAVQLRYARRVSGFSELAITKLDVLDKLGKIKICVGYEHSGQRVSNIPADVRVLEDVKPIYITVDGWRQDTTKIQNFNKLPQKAKDYVQKVEELVGVRISMVSVGKDRAQTIIR